MKNYFDEHIWDETKLQKISTAIDLAPPEKTETDFTETPLPLKIDLSKPSPVLAEEAAEVPVEADTSELKVIELDFEKPEPESIPTGNGPIPAPMPSVTYPHKKKSKLPIVAACLAAVLVGVQIGVVAVPAVIGQKARTAAFDEFKDGGETAFRFEEASAAPTAAIYNPAAGYDIPSVIAKVESAVVSINVMALAEQRFLNRVFTTERPSAGSGIVFHEDNENIYIATNNHVIDAAKTVSISFDDTTEVPASYVGSNPDYDLAVIAVLKSDLHENGIDKVTLAEFGDSDELVMGQTVIAIGNALGEGKSATLGIVSATDKAVIFEDGTNMAFIQTDAAINPGNSGGPLIDTNSRVVGINSAKYSDSAVEGMGFSIPISTAKQVIEEIMTGSLVKTPFLGISGETVTPEMKGSRELPDGVAIMEILRGGSAEAAGLELYDIITEFNGTPVTTMQELQKLIPESNVGDTVMVTVYRDSREIAVQVTMMDQNATKF